MTTLELAGITKRHGGAIIALDGVTLTVASGELLALVGPSGSGKSSLLRIVAGLDEPTSGTIRIDGTDVTRSAPSERGVAMVFQDQSLYPHLTIQANLDLPLRTRGVARRERVERVDEALERFGLGAWRDRRPETLSGGEAQRVALARAMVVRPRVLLLDEPFASLDPSSRLELRTQLRDLHDADPVTTIHVTHDQEEALSLGDRVAVLDAGRLRQVGTPRDVYDRPADTRVGRLVGATPMNLVPGRVAGDGDGHARFHPEGATTSLVLPAPAEDAEGIVLGVRPECLIPAEAGAAGTWSFTLERRIDLGWWCDLWLRDPAGAGPRWRARVRTDDVEGWAAGNTVAMRPHASGVHVFDANGAHVSP